MVLMSSIASKLLKPILIGWMTFWFSKQLITMLPCSRDPTLFNLGYEVEQGILYFHMGNWRIR